MYVMQDPYTQQRFFDEVACEWDEINDSDKYETIRRIFESKLLPLTGPVLDVGCGTGILLPLLAQLNSTYVHELDISGQMLRMARNKFQSSNHHSYLQADAHFLPCQDCRFGTVFCFCVYPHFYDQEQATDEIYRVLLEGGRMIVLHLMDHQELNQMHASKNKVVAGDILPPAGILAGRLRRRGFRIEHCEERAGFYLVTGIK